MISALKRLVVSGNFQYAQLYQPLDVLKAVADLLIDPAIWVGKLFPWFCVFTIINPQKFIIKVKFLKHSNKEAHSD